MKRIALFVILVALVAVHTGCRVSSTCCPHQPCCPSDIQESMPVLEPEEAAAETARRWISDEECECVGGACSYDPALPPTPVADQEA